MHIRTGAAPFDALGPFRLIGLVPLGCLDDFARLSRDAGRKVS